MRLKKTYLHATLSHDINPELKWLFDSESKNQSQDACAFAGPKNDKTVVDEKKNS